MACATLCRRPRTADHGAAGCCTMGGECRFEVIAMYTAATCSRCFLVVSCVAVQPRPTNGCSRPRRRRPRSTLPPLPTKGIVTRHSSQSRRTLRPRRIRALAVSELLKPPSRRTHPWRSGESCDDAARGGDRGRSPLPPGGQPGSSRGDRGRSCRTPNSIADAPGTCLRAARRAAGRRCGQRHASSTARDTRWARSAVRGGVRATAAYCRRAEAADRRTWRDVSRLRHVDPGGGRSAHGGADCLPGGARGDAGPVGRRAGPFLATHLGPCDQGAARTRGPRARAGGEPCRVGCARLRGRDRPAPGPGVVHRRVPQTLGRWPDEGFVATGEILGNDTFTVWDSIRGCRDGKFQYVEDRPSTWVDEPDVRLYGYWFWDWYEEFQKVAAVDAGTRTFTLAKPYSQYGYRQGHATGASTCCANWTAPASGIWIAGAARCIGSRPKATPGHVPRRQ